MRNIVESLMCLQWFDQIEKVKCSFLMFFVCLVSFFFFLALGFELRAYTLSHSTNPFLCDEFFEIWSHELFAQDGFEQQSS
jgi:hypothetical protein